MTDNRYFALADNRYLLIYRLFSHLNSPRTDILTFADRLGSEKMKPKCDMKVKKSKSTLAFALSKQQIELWPRTRKMRQASFFLNVADNQ